MFLIKVADTADDVIGILYRSVLVNIMNNYETSEILTNCKTVTVKFPLV